MSGFRERIAHGPALLLDGGLGTMLLARGLAAGEAPESWNLSRPGDVSAVHRLYVEAGSEAVHTNTFGAHPIRLFRAGLAGRCAEICAAAVAAARAAGPRWVIGDLGPTGDYLPPVGRADPAATRHGYQEQARALAVAGAHALHVETQSDLREARLALEGARTGAPGLPVLVSLTFERKPRGFFTVMGDPLLESLTALAGAGADAVGANCSIASGRMVELAREALAIPRTRLVVQPNAGQPDRDAAGALVYTQPPAEFAADLATLASEVAAFGGCCGTDPRFVAALARTLARAA